jgi:citrate lyase subunit beta/citryl-CoA lyase
VDLLRSLLFVPGNREHMLEKALTATADAVIIDLEDAVPPAEKKAARRLARTWVPRLARAQQRVYVRVNAIDSGQTRDDVQAAVRRGIAGVVLPKAQTAQDLRSLDVLLREAEMGAKIRPGDVRTMPIIESARGILRCEEIATASDRVAALALGGEDYTAELGVPRDAGGAALAYPRGVLVTVATTYGLPAIDAPYADVRDAKGLSAESALARAMGFKGKFAIHPGQVAALHRAFAPSRDEIDAARDIVRAAEAAAAEGIGAISVAGRMVDAPVVERARRVLAVAEAIRARRRALRHAAE